MKAFALLALLFLVSCGKPPSVKPEKSILGVWKLTAAEVEGLATPFEPEFIRFKDSSMENVKPNGAAWTGKVGYRISGNKLILKESTGESAAEYLFDQKKFNLRLFRNGKPVTYIYTRPAESDRATYPAE